MPVADCQYYLQGDEFFEIYDDTDTVTRILEGNSLAAGGPEHLTVYAGTREGRIRLTTQQLADMPPAPDADWETVVDVSVCSTSGTLWLTEPEGDVVEEAGNFAIAGPGWYRVRVQVRGRDNGGTASDNGSAEEHLLSIWPAPAEPDVVHRAEDGFARAHYDKSRPPGLPVQPDDPKALLDPADRFDATD